MAGQVQNPSKGQIKRLIIFGDSLSDPGNLNRRTLGFMVPARIFYKSRFSNGPIWADYIAPALNWSIDNHAVGGAETRTASPIENLMIPSVLQQIDEHKDALKTADFASTLVAIWIGPNNYFNHSVAVQDANQNPLPALLDKQVQAVIADIREAIEDLQGIGFRSFVIGTMPELGGINRNPLDPPKASDNTLFAATAAHNSALRAMVKTLAKDEPTLNLTLYQANEINQATIENPKNFGFTRLDQPCFLGSLQGRFAGEKRYCSDPSGFKFWEYLHPNSKMHCYYASQFLADIQISGKIAGFDRDKAMARCQSL